MSSIAYSLNVPYDIGSRVQRAPMIERVRSALGNSGRYTVHCVDAETRVNTVLGMRRVVIVIKLAVDRIDRAPLDAADYVMLDSIAFGAMKSVTGQGWSVLEIRSRLSPVGTSEESSVTTVFRDPSGAKRVVSPVNECSLSSVTGAPGQTLTVLDGAAPGAARENAPVLPPSLTDMPWYYKAAIVGGVTLVGAVAVGYVVRSFK